MNPAPPLLIFYSRIDAFGDGLLRLPALRAARTAFPDARIVYGCAGPSTLEKALRRHVEYLVDEFRTNTPLGEILVEFRGTSGARMIADSRNLAPRLMDQRLRLVGRNISYEANFPGFALSFPFRWPEPRPEHNAWRYHRMVERLAGRALPFDHRLTPPAAARAEAQRLHGSDPRPMVLTNANGAGDQRLAAEQVAAVATGLCDRGCRVVHLITPGDGPPAAQLLALEPRMEIVAPSEGLKGAALDDLFLALGEIADAYIGSDGGMAHLMATVLAPMVVINRGFSVARWRPLSSFVEIIEAGDSSRSGQVRDTPPALILDAADRLLAARRRDHGGR